MQNAQDILPPRVQGKKRERKDQELFSFNLLCEPLRPLRGKVLALFFVHLSVLYGSRFPCLVPALPG